MALIGRALLAIEQISGEWKVGKRTNRTRARRMITYLVSGEHICVGSRRRIERIDFTVYNVYREVGHAQ